MDKVLSIKGQEVVVTLKCGEDDKELRIFGTNGSGSLFYWSEVTAEELENLGEFTAMVTEFYSEVSKLERDS